MGNIYKVTYFSLGNKTVQTQQQQKQPPPQPQRTQDRPQRGWANRGIRRARGRAGFNRQAQPSKARNILKFESEYDFEQANEEFVKIRNQLAKTKIGK